VRLLVKTAKKDIKAIYPEILIIGDGSCLEEDLRIYLSWQPKHEVMAVGRAYQKYAGEVRHWANVDANEAKWWAEHLPWINGQASPIRHTLGEYDWFDVAWDVVDGKLWDPAEVLWHGSSSLFAVYACLAMGYESIVLAGCPMDALGHWYDRTAGPRWTGESYQAWLQFAATPEARKVTSISGYTRQILRGGALA